MGLCRGASLLCVRGSFSLVSGVRLAGIGLVNFNKRRTAVGFECFWEIDSVGLCRRASLLGVWSLF